LGIGSLFYTLGAVAEYLIEGHFGRAIARHRMDRKIERLTGHGVICGFGRVGRRIAREFADAGQSFVVIDKLEVNVAELDAAGCLYVHGDATQDATLLEAGVCRAQSLLAATDADTENIAITLSARALAPGLWIVARANREESENKLVRAGADRVLSPYTLGGHRMAGLARQPQLMEFLDTAVKSRELDLALTVIQVEVGSPFIGMSLPAGVEALPSGMHDSNVIAVRPAGQGQWRAASRRKGKPVAAGDWLVVLGPVDQRQPGSVPEAITHQPRSETAPAVRRQGAEDDGSQGANPDGSDDDGARSPLRE
jgi:voltage-gated potassium channel